MPFLRYLPGRALSSQEEGEYREGVMDGVSVSGLDELGSAAYGPEAALTVLLPVGTLIVRYVVLLYKMITALLLLLVRSAVRKHYDREERCTQISGISHDYPPQPLLTLVPVARWNKAEVSGLPLACCLSNDVRVLHKAELAGQRGATCNQRRFWNLRWLEERGFTSTIGSLTVCTSSSLD